MRILVLLFFALILVACNKQSKEELFSQGQQELQAGNRKGAIVYFLNALEQDPSFIDARQNLAIGYLSLGKLRKAETELTTILEQSPGNIRATLTLAQIFNHSQRSAQAITLTEKLLASGEEKALALEVLGDSYRVQGEPLRSKDYYLRALQADPDKASIKLGLARVLRILNELTEARQLLNEILVENPTERMAYFDLVSIESSLGDGQKALEILSQYTKIAPDDIQALYWSGVLLLNNQSLSEAEAVANTLLVEHPGHPGGRQIKGLIHYTRGDYPAAIVELKQQLKKYPDLLGHHFIGLAYYQTKQFELALNHFQKALDIEPQHIQSRLLVARTLLRQERFDSCIAEIVKMLQVETNNALAYYVLGSAYMGKGNYDRAIESLDKAIEINPALVDAQVKKGLFNLVEGKIESAEAELVKAIAAAPQITNNRLLLASLQIRQKNFPAALQTLQQGLTNKPADALLYNYMAVAHFGQEDAEKALEALEQAKRLRPEFLAPSFSLAKYYTAINSDSKAFAEYELILQKAPGNTRALIEIALLHEINGHTTEALSFYQKGTKTGDVDGFMALSAYWLRRNEHSRALTIIDNAYSRHPQDAQILEQRGRLAIALGQSGKGIESFQALEQLGEGRGLPLLITYYLHKGQAEEALRICREIIKDKPASGYGYSLLASVYVYQGQFSQVEETLLKGIPASNKNQLTLQIRLCSHYIVSRQQNKAKILLEELRHKYPRSAEVLFTYGNLYESLGDKQQAASLFEATLSENKNHLGALNNLAYLYAGDATSLDKAFDLALRAFRLVPNNPQLMDTLGYILAQKGQNAKAVKLLEQAVILLPQVPEVKLHLGQAYLALGQKEEARAILQPLAESTSPLFADEARQLLATLRPEQE